jgi:AcrR family transcriptional regulator
VLKSKSEDNKAKRQRMSSQERHDFILARSKGVFASNSYREASTSQLAQQSDVSEPMLYKHFGSKKNLFLAVLQQFGKMFSQNWQGQLASNTKGEPLKALEEIGLAYREAIKTDPDILKVFFQAIAESSDTEIAGVARQNVRDLHDFIQKLLQKAQLKGEIAAGLNLEAATWGYMSMAFAMQISLMLQLDQELDETLLKEMNNLWLRGLQSVN